MNRVIRTNAQAHKVAERLNNRVFIGESVNLANLLITKIDDREFRVDGKRYVCSELADFIIWPNRKAWNAEIWTANRN